MNPKVPKSKHRVLTWILIIMIIFLTATLALSAYVIAKLNQNNLFSKSILLDNNYFITNNIPNSLDDNDIHKDMELSEVDISNDIGNALKKLLTMLNEKYSDYLTSENINDILIIAEKNYYSYGVSD